MDSLLSFGVREDRSLPGPQALPDPTASADYTATLADADARGDTQMPEALARPVAELLPAEPAAAGHDQGAPAPGANALPEMEQGETPPGQAEAGRGRPGQPDSDQSEPEDLDPDPTLSGRLIPIGLLSGASQLALAGTAPELPAVGGATAPSASARLASVSQAAQDWASRRSFGLSSASGVSIALAVCAAGWFSAGTRIDILRGVGALWAGYLALRAGQFLSAPPQPSRVRHQPSGGTQPSGASQASGAQRSRSVLVDGEGALGHTGALRRPAATAGWVAALGVCLAESVVYLGLATGAAAEHWARAWPCAIAVLGLVGVRNLMTRCSTPRGFGDHPDGALRGVCAALLTMPGGGRILLIGVVAPLWGARAALLALLEWAIISIAYGLAGRAAEGVVPNDDGSSSGRMSVLLRLRDDGALARTLGTLVRGSLLPLPPAVLGLLAVAALALVGLHDLPGVLMIAPAAVMLLAAPGSAHPHTGRLDWLIPSLLLGAQVLYFTAVGLGARVPEPVIFLLVATLLMRYIDLAFPGRPVILAKPRHPGEQRGERGSALGWEGRLLLLGVAAAVGIATFAYLALTAYLGLLIFAKIVVSSQTRQEEDRS